MMRKEIVMKMLLEKLKAAFGGAGHPSYRITVDEGKTGVIEVTDSERESVYFDVIYDEDAETFIYAGDNIDSATLRALVNIEDAIEEEYLYSYKEISYEVMVSGDCYPYSSGYNHLDDAIEKKRDVEENSDLVCYINKKTTITERVIL